MPKTLFRPWVLFLLRVKPHTKGSYCPTPTPCTLRKRLDVPFHPLPPNLWGCPTQGCQQIKCCLDYHDHPVACDPGKGTFCISYFQI